jgi:hypothetical protein
MGEVISDLGHTELQDNPCEYLDIELNRGNIIHLQTNAWRIELTLNEFVDFSKTILTAASKLRKNKNI